MTTIATASMFLTPTGQTYWFHITYDSHSPVWYGTGYVDIGPFTAASTSSDYISAVQTAVKNDIAAHGVTVGGGDYVKILDLPTG